MTTTAETMKRAHERKLAHRRNSPRWAVADEELENLARELVAVVMSVPEKDRGVFYLGAERYASYAESKGSDFYDFRPVLRAFTKLANACWPSWPEPDVRTCVESSDAPTDGADASLPSACPQGGVVEPRPPGGDP